MGNWKDGLKQGRGIRKYKDGSKYDGEYANFPDIYDAYLNWECSLNNTKIMEQHAFGHYLTKFTGIKSTTSTIPGKADSWNTIYMGIGLKFPLEQQIRPQFGELYRFRHIWLMETGDFNDCTIIKEIYKRYLQWTKLDSLEPYSFSLFSSRLRKFFNEKKVSFEQICLSGNKLKIIRGVKLI